MKRYSIVAFGLPINGSNLKPYGLITSAQPQINGRGESLSNWNAWLELSRSSRIDGQKPVSFLPPRPPAVPPAGTRWPMAGLPMITRNRALIPSSNYPTRRPVKREEDSTLITSIRGEDSPGHAMARSLGEDPTMVINSARTGHS